MRSGPGGADARDTTPDACPGAVRVHEAADGGLARIRVPGGALGAPQLAVLARAAAELGDPSLELTSRGNLQIRALAPGAERDLAARLHAAGLLPSEAHERVRNVVASPLSGRDGVGLLDVRPIVTALDELILASRVSAGLPGRFLMTLDDGRGDVTGLIGDVGLHATASDRLALLLAGVDSGLRVGVADAAALGLAAALAFLSERAALSSNAWRVAELPDGVARITSALRAGGAGGPVPGEKLVSAQPAKRPPVGLLPQSDGRGALSLVVPLGRLTQAACAALVDLAGTDGEIIVTPWRAVVVPDLLVEPSAWPDPRPGGPVADPGSARWVADATSAGLVADPRSAWVDVTACAGRPHCAKANADVQRLAHDVVAGAAPTDGTVLPVHWAGCERRCGHPAGRHVEVLAEPDGRFSVTLDGRGERIDRPEQLTIAVAGWRKP